MKKALLIIGLFMFVNVFSQSIKTEKKYGANIIQPTLDNILFALLNRKDFKNQVISIYKYTLESDGNYYAPTGVGKPYYSIGFKGTEIVMIWTKDFDFNSIITSELRNMEFVYSNGNASYKKTLNNGLSINLFFQQNAYGGGVLTAVIR